MSKQAKINKEIKELEKIFKDISANKKKLATRLIERASFMKITLEELEESINEQGATCKFEQGKQKMIIENPAQKSYNTMINRYASVYKQLTDLLDKSDTDKKEIGDGFEEFVTTRS